MKITLLLLPLLLLLAACTPGYTQEDCTDMCEQQAAQAHADCPTRNCPFDITYDTDTYVKQDYFVIKPILPDIDAEDCDNALAERRNTTASLCKVQHAEIIREAGREAGKDTWQWRIDCACSYQP